VDEWIVRILMDGYMDRWMDGLWFDVLMDG
jgi:hypothetical protein